MKKQDLINAVAARTGLKKTAVAEVLDTSFDVLVQALEQGGEAGLGALGKLKVVVRAARTGRNPHTGEAMPIPAKTVAKFVSSKALANVLNP